MSFCAWDQKIVSVMYLEVSLAPADTTMLLSQQGFEMPHTALGLLVCQGHFSRTMRWLPPLSWTEYLYQWSERTENVSEDLYTII